MNQESLKEMNKVFRVENTHSKDAKSEDQISYKCPKCTMTFPTNGAKRTHIWRDHNKKQEKMINRTVADDLIMKDYKD